ncbi:unnamed protein product [Cuscuta epithymum]|uniref:Uncharacterized protein n=1 Tax=Cuscuta epithymum TaxID=186058 RepID=A0AAV0CTK2_9ASTE|nr:unnamed protein product [Cuscuta epithymum]
MTGSMQLYVKKLRQYAGELPLVCSDYGASEGWVGLNVNPRSLPEMAIFTVLPNVAYFEFIPLMNSEDMEPSAVDLTQVKDGEQYEVVITNGLGLYRYRLGDIVEVRGFHNSSTPQLRFVRRKNLLLNIDIDKNTEEDVQLSVETAAKILSDSSSNLELLDFTSHVNTSTYPGHYVVFWEVNGEESDHLHHHHQVLQECCNCLDSSFLDLGYMTSRKARTIGPLELKIVRRGTFNKILNHYVGLGTAATQFKSPRFVGDTNGAVLEILMNNVVITYSSTAYP